MEKQFGESWGKLPTDGDSLLNENLVSVPIHPPTCMFISKCLEASTSASSVKRENEKTPTPTPAVTLNSPPPTSETKKKEKLSREEVLKRKKARRDAMTEEEKQKWLEKRRLRYQERRAEFAEKERQAGLVIQRRLPYQERRAELAEKERQAGLALQRGNLTEAEVKLIEEVEQEKFRRISAGYMSRQARRAIRGRRNKNETEEEMEERLKRLREKRKIQYSMCADEEKEKSRRYYRERLRTETPLQREKRIALQRKYFKQYSEWPEDKKKKYLEYCRRKTAEETPEKRQARLERYKRNIEKRKQIKRLMDEGITKEEAESLLRQERPELFPIQRKPLGRPQRTPVPHPVGDLGRKQKNWVEKYVRVTENSANVNCDRSEGKHPEADGEPRNTRKSDEGHVENIIPVNRDGCSLTASKIDGNSVVPKKSAVADLPTITLEADKNAPTIASSAPLTLKRGIKTYERKRFECNVCGKKFSTEKLSQAHVLQEHESDCHPFGIFGADDDTSASVSNPFANDTAFSPPSPVSAPSPSSSVPEPDPENFDRSETDINPVRDEDVGLEVPKIEPLENAIEDVDEEVHPGEMEQPTNSRGDGDTSKSGDDNLKSNSQKDHTKIPKFVCEMCKKAYVNEHAYKVHIRDSHREPGGKSFACPAKGCSRVFSHSWTRNNHYNTYHFPSFASETRRRRKRKGEEGGESSTICAYCGKRFSESFDLSRHVRDLHPTESEKADQVPNICEYCSKEFKQRCTLDDHIRRVHLGILNKCDVCGRCFQSAVKLWRHKVDFHEMDLDLSAVGNAQLKLCPFCGDCVFRGLQAHVQKHHPERLEEYFANRSSTGRIRDPNRGRMRSFCELCNNTFSGTGTAKRQNHIRVHHPESYHPDPEGDHHCGICQKKGMTEKRLTWHILVRHHEKIGLTLKANPEDGSLPCQFCSSPQNDEEDYMKHILNDHPEDFTTFVETRIKEGKVLNYGEVVNIRMKKRRLEEKRQKKSGARKCRSKSKAASGNVIKDEDEIFSDDESDISQRLRMDSGSPGQNVRRSSRISSRKRSCRRKDAKHRSLSVVPSKSEKSGHNLLTATELKILERFHGIEWGTPVVLVKRLTVDEIRVLTDGIKQEID